MEKSFLSVILIHYLTYFLYVLVLFAWVDKSFSSGKELHFTNEQTYSQVSLNTLQNKKKKSRERIDFRLYLQKNPLSVSALHFYFNLR